MAASRDAHSYRDRRSAARVPSRLRRLRDVDGYEVADGYPDIRGWTVKTVDDTTIGAVEDLVVDVQALRVRYLDVALADALRDATRTAAIGEAIRQASRASADDAGVGRPDAGEGHTLIPVGDVRLDERRDEVVVERLTSEEIVGLPRYGGLALTDEYEAAVRSRRFDDEVAAAGAGGTLDYAHDAYDDQRLFAGRRAAPTEDPPASAAPAAGGTPTIGEEEIRVPLMREELVVAKRVVPREEIIVRTETVTAEQVVDVELRRERAEVREGVPADGDPAAPVDRPA